MIDDETATTICGKARAASDRGNMDEAAALLEKALAKAEDVHGPDGMIVAQVLRNLMVFHHKADHAEQAAEARVRLELILKKHGIAHSPTTPLPQFSKLKIV